MVLTAPSAEARKNYKYKDADGVWHFSDRPPGTAQPVEVEQVRVGKTPPKVTLSKKEYVGEHEFSAVNEYGGPVQLKVSLAEEENLLTEPPLPFDIVLPGRKTVKVFSIKPADKRKRWRYRTRYSYIPGDPSAEHRPEKPYRPPVPVGEDFRISQAFEGKFSHNDPHSRFAVDIPLPVGTPIYAARGGVVMEIANDFFSGGAEKEAFGTRANLVRILHDDGTMAIYGHLKLESVRFGVGRRISVGEFIAGSGNTGFSTGPHLHFAVQKNSGLALESVPFEFEGEGGKPMKPESGMIIRVPVY